MLERVTGTFLRLYLEGPLSSVVLVELTESRGVRLTRGVERGICRRDAN